MRKRYGLELVFCWYTDIILQNQKEVFRSELILNVYAIHLRKVAGAPVTYGEHYGALALCTTAVSHLVFMPFTHRNY